MITRLIKTKITISTIYKIVLMLLAFSIYANAQSTTNSESFHKVVSGLTQHTIKNISEDSDGFLWIGTQNGLYRYNGENFKFYNNFDAVENTTIYVETIYNDDKGQLYIGTPDGLDIYNKELDQIEEYSFKNEGEELKNHHFISIKKTNNTLWLGTLTQGLFKYDIESGKVEEFIDNEGDLNSILKIEIIDDNRLLVVSPHKLTILDTNLSIINTHKESKQIKAVSVSKNGMIYTGLINGQLIAYELDNNTFIEKENQFITKDIAILSLQEDNDNNLWIGTENDGIYRKDLNLKKSKELKQTIDKSSDKSIWSLYIDNNGVLWIGTFRQGLYFYNNNYHKFRHIKKDYFNDNSLNNNNVNTFYEDKNGIWIGTDGGGLNYWNRSFNTFESYSAKNNTFNTDIVLSILKTKENEIWVGSWNNGLSIFNTETKTYKTLNTNNSSLLSNNIMAMAKDKEGKVWISSLYGGLQIYDVQNNTFENIEVPFTMKGAKVSSSILAIHIDQKNNIWLGSYNYGLIKVTKKDGKWNFTACMYLKGMQNENNHYVNAITENHKGEVLVGSVSGLYKYNESDNSFINITENNGYINLNVIGIVEDEKNKLWLSTRKGIYSYDPTTTEIDSYDVEDGLQGAVFSHGAFLKTKSNEILFGGSNGFNIFSPENIQKTKTKHEIFISNLKIFNESIVINDNTQILEKHINQVESIDLSYQQNNFELEFNALTFFHPHKVKYAYYLEGFESKWNYVGNRHNAVYTNLDPGNYIFKVKSTNSDGIWNDTEKILSINIAPPFWQTLWFKILAFLLLIGLLNLIYKNRVQKIKNQKRELENKVKERTAQLVKQSKKLKKTAKELSQKNEEIQRFTYAVSHDLKSPLGGIKGIASIIPLEFKLQDFPGLQDYLDMINISCDTMNTLIADITELAKVGKIENKYELIAINEIVDLSVKLVDTKIKANNIQLKIDPNLPQIHGDKNRMIQVFGNLIDNAIKYMGKQENPLIEIKVSKNEDSAIFQIIDNGMGMNERALNKLFTPFERFHQDTQGTGLGLYMIKQIVESHSGEITATSEGENKGATFSVELPLEQEEILQEKE